MFLDIVNQWFSHKKKEIIKDLEKRSTDILRLSIGYYDMGIVRIDNSSILKNLKKIKIKK